ncbi:MAG: hypothetical protein DRP71_10840 [Verrucomicrobia bacterium]|nr:MAG: hypothetical protein DRP71_10840 [Verrucomicrobiota bacterium]
MDTRIIKRISPIRARRSRAFTVDPIFRSRLAGYDLRRLGASRDTIYLLDAALCIRGFNSEYERFARRNGGRSLMRHYGLGAAVLDGFTAFYAAHYRDVFRRCLDERRPYSKVHVSSSPRAFRRYRETIEPLREGLGLLVSHRLVETMVRSEAGSFDPLVHLSPDGLILQCCHCHRIRNHRLKGRWDWLPDETDDSRFGVSHGLCPQCLNTYYPNLETVEL